MTKEQERLNAEREERGRQRELRRQQLQEAAMKEERSHYRRRSSEVDEQLFDESDREDFMRL